MNTENTSKNATSTQLDFKVVETNNKIESINKAKQVFHFIDLDYLKKGIIFHGWIGYRSNDQIKAVLDGHFIDLYSKYKCKKMLIENTQMTGSFSAINDWLGSYFMPKMINMGLTSNAVVLPKNVFAQLAVEDWDQKVGGFTTRNFDSIDNALKWLATA